MQKPTKSPSSKKTSENMLMGLMNKMSEAYMTAKGENEEFQKKIETLERENGELKAKIEILNKEKEILLKEKIKEKVVAKKEKKEIVKNDVNMDDIFTMNQREAPKKFENTKHTINNDEGGHVKKKKSEPLNDIALPPAKADQHRSIRARMIEEEMLKPRGFRKADSSSSSSSDSSRSRSRSKSKSVSRKKPANESRETRSRSRSVPKKKRPKESRSRSRSISRKKQFREQTRSKSRAYQSRSRSRSRSMSHDRRSRSKSNSRPQKRRVSRSRSKSRHSSSRSPSWNRNRKRRSPSDSPRRSRSQSREHSSKDMDKQMKREELLDKEKDRKTPEEKEYRSAATDINLDEWRPKKGDDPTKIDPALALIREKFKLKQEAEAAKKKKEEESKKKITWTAMKPINTTEYGSNKNEESSTKEKVDMSVRPQVAIQWGNKTLRNKTAEPQTMIKKAMPFVGKMPGKRDTNRDSNSPAKTKFGPPSGNSVPPPVVTTANPTPPPQPPKQTSFQSSTMMSYPSINRRAPKNPTPKDVDLKDMLAAAKAHMVARGEAIPDRAKRQSKLDMEIPLPPLPAAQDRDPDAMKDTRPLKPPTPPPIIEKTELDLMLEKHAMNIPPGFSKDKNIVEVKLPPTLQPKPNYDMSLYNTYAAHWGPGFDPRAAAELAMPPVGLTGPRPEVTEPPSAIEPPNPEATLAAVVEAVPIIETAAEKIDEAEAANNDEETDEVDPDELAMLGIDPSDFAGFGK